ncbi:MAG: RtcB family protein, partial [Dehalococcoidia bacterium]|nr:RtcB family protein [Dehalococcoidia bacterium]
MYSRQGPQTFFEVPLRYINEPYEGDFLRFRTKYGVDQCLTPDHRCLVYKYDRYYRFEESCVELAEDIFQRHQRLKNGYRHRFLTSFPAPSLPGVSLSDEELRVVIMAAADGHYDSRNPELKTCVVRFKKVRKIVRAEKILREASVTFRRLPIKEGVTSFSFTSPQRVKDLSALYACSPTQLRVVCEEAFHWDGDHKEGVFYTRCRESADFMNYAFSACGYRSTVHVDLRDDGTDYRVSAHDNLKVGINGAPKTDAERLPSAGRKYCFTTSTGFWVMRRNGRVAITGNCGMMAVETTMQAKDLPDDLGGIRATIEKKVPHGAGPDSGKGNWRNPPETVQESWGALDTIATSLKEKFPKIFRGNEVNQLGTMGGGNHFLEICLDERDVVWVMLHSGSRGIGNRIGSYFINLAKKDMERWFINLPDKDLAYFPEGSEHFEDYC